MTHKIRHTFLEKATRAILDSYTLRDEDDQLLPQVGDTIEHHDQSWTIAEIIPVTPDIDDPDHPEAAVDIVCGPANTKNTDGEPAPALGG